MWKVYGCGECKNLYSDLCNSCIAEDIPTSKPSKWEPKDIPIVKAGKLEVKERPESDHYHTGSVDVWQFADENLSVDEVTGFHRINILKYVTRYGKKKGYNRTDLEKAKVMIDKLLELHDKHRK